MSLDFQFGKTGDPAWQARWEKLTKNEQSFVYNYLPFALMATEVGQVTDASIPHILQRSKVVLGDMEASMIELEIESTHGKAAAVAYKDAKQQAAALIAAATPKDFVPDPTAYMRRFIGMRTNVVTLTASEFVKRRVAYKDRDALVPPMSKAQATAIATTKVAL